MSDINAALQRRIDDQNTLTDNSIISSDLQDIGEYYWRSSKPQCWGLSVPPRLDRERSILPQVLMIPSLIVDMVPCSGEKFTQTYGVHPYQLEELAEGGYITPNFYHYQNNSWQEYEEHPDVARILSRYGRVNSYCIERYLNKRYDFKSVKDQMIQFFERIKVEEPEQHYILTACYERIPDWRRVAATLGQRLAYIQILGGQSGSEAVAKIKDIYENPTKPEDRVAAVKLVIASKNLFASTTTAAYDGEVIFDEDQLEDIKFCMDELKNLTDTPWSQLPNNIVVNASFALELVEKIKAIEASPFSARSPVHTGPLEPATFKEFKDDLQRVRDGLVGRLMSEMTTVLVDPNRSTEELCDLAKELHEALHWHKRFVPYLDLIGASLIAGGLVSLPLNDWSSWSLLTTAGKTLRYYAARWKNAQFVPPLFMRKYQFKLYADFYELERRFKKIA